jgi:hypothetical protein
LSPSGFFQFMKYIKYTHHASRAYTTTPQSMEVPSIVDATAEPHRFSRPRYYMTEWLYQ